MSPSMNLVTKKFKYYEWVPSSWDHDYVQSLKNNYTEPKYGRRAEKVKDEVRRMLVDHKKESLFFSSSNDLLKLINIIQRLGIGYHFIDEIKAALRNIKDEQYIWEKEDIFMQAVRFRLLRQHGYEVSPDVFKNFMEKTRSSKDLMMKACMENNKDIVGILNVYEASFYAFLGENILDEVQEFTVSFLKEYLILIQKEKGPEEGNNSKFIMKRLVSHALELQLHWRMQRLECKWFIETYEMMREDMNPLLLEFAILDFNIVQANHQKDLKVISRWWQDLNYLDILIFSRDRWAETFLWTMGYDSEPAKLRNCGIHITKLSCLLTTLDDMNEIFVSGDECKIFYDAVERWDINSIGDLPYNMKICFIALFNTINDIAYDILKNHGFHAISYLRTAIADFWKRYIEEAKWHHYTPTLEEYLDTAWVTAGGYVISTVALLAVAKEPTKDALESITNDKLHDVRRYAFEIVRLTNDLGTSSDEIARYDTPTAIQCVMHEKGVTESAAREHVKQVISNTWKKMNSDKFSGSVYPELVVDAIQSFARASHCLYQFGDGYGVGAEPLTKGHIISLFLEPIPMAYDETY